MLDEEKEIQILQFSWRSCNFLVLAAAKLRMPSQIWDLIPLKAKLSPKCNRVKPSCKSIITTKEALLRFTIFLFLVQTLFQWECYRCFYVSIKISVFKTVRSLDTT